MMDARYSSEKQDEEEKEKEKKKFVHSMSDSIQINRLIKSDEEQRTEI